MYRIILLIIRLIYKVPYYIIRIKQMKDFEKYDRQTRYNLIRKLIKDVIRAAHVDVIATGMEKLPEQDGFLITPNHQGMFDPFLLVSTIERPITCVCKKELEKTPVIKDIIQMLPALTMDRSNLRESVKIIRKVSAEIGEGRNYVIFPEGTRSKNGNNLLEFKGGTMKAGVDKQAPIVPAAIIDSFVPFDSKSIKRVTAEIHYLDPIYYDEYKDWNSIELANVVQTRIQNKINEVLEARK